MIIYTFGAWWQIYSPFPVLFCIAVSFPFLEPLIHWIMHSLKAGKAMDFLGNSAAKIIDGRRKQSDLSAQVNLLVHLWLE